MKTKRTIRKILFVCLWLTIGGGMLTLLIAAMGKQRRDLCKEYSISIRGVQADEFFLDEADILSLLKVVTKGKIKGQPKSAFNLRQMEELLEGNQWVKNAQVYFDSRDVLHVTVIEREPVARVFTQAGRSFYLDDQGRMMDLSDRLSARLPVFTGFPDRKLLRSRDSLLLDDLVRTAVYINGNPFWSAQVAQINISQAGTGEAEMEMVPLIGNHTVKLGNGENIGKKFDRLFLFYKKVLSKSGFDKYKTIDIRFDGQVVAAKSENPRVDSVQLRRNVEKLLKQIKEMEELNEQQAKLPTPTPVQQVMPAAEGPVAGESAGAASTGSESKESKKKTETGMANPKQPKAVMPKRTRN